MSARFRRGEFTDGLVHGIERAGDFKEESDTTATLEVINRKNGQSSGPITFSPETSRSEPVGNRVAPSLSAQRAASAFTLTSSVGSSRFAAAMACAAASP